MSKVILSVFVAVIYTVALSSCGGEAHDSVTIGRQKWMTKNLNVDKFRNGDPIPEARTYREWVEAAEDEMPAWCYYDNDTANGEKYGKLYNWYAVSDPRGIAPEGWHVPSKAEWKMLTDYLCGDLQAELKMRKDSLRVEMDSLIVQYGVGASFGLDSYLQRLTDLIGSQLAYRRLRSASGWQDDDILIGWQDDDNQVSWEELYDMLLGDTTRIAESGFDGLPGGFRKHYAPHDRAIGEAGLWWSSTECSGKQDAWGIGIGKGGGGEVDDLLKKYGLSVRCLKD